MGYMPSSTIHNTYIKPRGTLRIDITEDIKVLIVVVKFQNLILQAKTQSKAKCFQNGVEKKSKN